jgi:hypothetical protein
MNRPKVKLGKRAFSGKKQWISDWTDIESSKEMLSLSKTMSCSRGMRVAPGRQQGLSIPRNGGHTTQLLLKPFCESD